MSISMSKVKKVIEKSAFACGLRMGSDRLSSLREELNSELLQNGAITLGQSRNRHLVADFLVDCWLRGEV